jgi:hypothetical protein
VLACCTRSRKLSERKVLLQAAVILPCNSSLPYSFVKCSKVEGDFPPTLKVRDVVDQRRRKGVWHIIQMLPRPSLLEDQPRLRVIGIRPRYSSRLTQIHVRIPGMTAYTIAPASPTGCKLCGHSSLYSHRTAQGRNSTVRGPESASSRCRRDYAQYSSWARCQRVARPLACRCRMVKLGHSSLRATSARGCTNVEGGSCERRCMRLTGEERHRSEGEEKMLARNDNWKVTSFPIMSWNGLDRSIDNAPDLICSQTTR